MEESDRSSPPLSSRSILSPSILALVLQNLKKEDQSLLFHLEAQQPDTKCALNTVTVPPRHHKALKEDPVAHEESLLRKKEADMKYRTKKKDYIGWKQQVTRMDAADQQHHKMSKKVSDGPRDYEVEQVIYQDKRREELQCQVADAQLEKELGHTPSRSARYPN
ncbi:hypothetical protein B0H17DRAFT_1123853 [Mycena rosella]|uniref:Uncharacterized protein n=1 Tax=Mycena rosella TaxID=1033263 RepID=A0AAD7H342_MYCRO|nr:hypothetical protein B0H17DRAFT_1123853 [Mycena rosella]